MDQPSNRARGATLVAPHQRKCLRHPIILAIALMLILLGKAGSVSADVGPKPRMEFTLSYEIESRPTIVEGILLECNDPGCTDAEPLPEAGPQGITCTAASCSSIAYGYRPYHQLVLTFSDGIVRRSSPFDKRRFTAHYRVTVREKDLEVKEISGLPNTPIWLLAEGTGLLCLGTVVSVALLITIIALIAIAHQEALATTRARPWLAMIWGLGIPVTALGGLVSLAIPITVALEAIVALVYARVSSRRMLITLTASLVANLVTVPILWGVFWGTNLPDTQPAIIILLAEVLIWAVETVLLRSLLKPCTWREAGLFSFLLNGVSLVVGLMLPF